MCNTHIPSNWASKRWWDHNKPTPILWYICGYYNFLLKCQCIFCDPYTSITHNSKNLMCIKCQYVSICGYWRNFPLHHGELGLYKSLRRYYFKTFNFSNVDTKMVLNSWQKNYQKSKSLKYAYPMSYMIMSLNPSSSIYVHNGWMEIVEL